MSKISEAQAAADMVAVGEIIDTDTPQSTHGITSSRIAEAASRRVQAVRLRLAGATYQTIADRMGYSDPRTAMKVVLRALDNIEAQNVTELRALENARLDAAQTQVWGILHGPDVDAAEKLRAANVFIRLSARRARMNGLDAPQQVEITATTRAELTDALASLRHVVLGELVTNDADV